MSEHKNSQPEIRVVTMKKLRRRIGVKLAGLLTAAVLLLVAIAGATYWVLADHNTTTNVLSSNGASTGKSSETDQSKQQSLNQTIKSTPVKAANSDSTAPAQSQTGDYHDQSHSELSAM